MKQEMEWEVVAMIQIPLEIFSYTNDAAAAARHGVLLYANEAAIELLGRDCVGKGTKELFGEIFSQAESACFLCQLNLLGEDYTLRAIQQEQIQLFFFSKCEEEPSLLGDAFLTALRSNMMNLGMVMELWREQAENEEKGEALRYLQDLSCCQYRLNRLIGNAALLRDYAHNELAIRRVPLNMSWLVHSAVDCVKFLHPDMNILLQIQEGLCVHGDPTLLKRMIFNLLSNCARHAKGMRRVQISLWEAGERLYLSVDDDGCGMDEKTLGQVFERYRYRYRLSEMEKGSGMGLSVVRAIARLHGGTLLLESKAGSGTRLRISLERTRADHRFACGEEAAEIKEALLDLSDTLGSDKFHERYMD